MIETRDLVLRYGAQTALRGVTLKLNAIGLTAVVGHSGCGKSSLVYTLSGLRERSGGAVWLDGIDLARHSRTALYRDKFSFIFQHHYVIGYLSAFENVVAAFEHPTDADRETAAVLLERLGLAGVAEKQAKHLSGGERQRVAVARGVARRSRYLFADEPTAALDRESARMVYALLREAAADRGVLLVTHDSEALALADRVIELRDGRLERSFEPLRVPTQEVRGPRQHEA